MTTRIDSSAVRAWAQAHPRATQWLIFGIFTLMGFIAFFYGMLVIGTGWYEAGWPLGLSLAALAGTVAFRIAWKDQAPNSFSWFAFHILSMLIFVSLAIYLGSRFPVKYGGQGSESSFAQAYASGAAPAELRIAEETASREAFGAAKPTWLQKKLEKARRFAKETPTGVKILLTLLVLLGAIAVGSGVGVLACGLACSDMGILALLVAVTGATGILWGGFVLILRIWEGKEKKEQRRQQKRKQPSGT